MKKLSSSADRKALNSANWPWLARLSDALRRFFDWRPQIILLPRSACHRVTIDVKGIAKRFLNSSIRLQLLQITGLSDIGFAWHIKTDADGKNSAEVWYWDEANLRQSGSIPPGELLLNGLLPCPEMLFRPALADGLHLIECQTGYEAVALRAGQLYRTRWFAEIPSPNIWQAFVRDAGGNIHLSIDQAAPPAAQKLTAIAKLPNFWKIVTGLQKPVPMPVIAGVASVILCGFVFSIAAAYELKLRYELASENRAYTRLVQENSVVIELQKQLAEQTAGLSTLSAAMPDVAQLNLMQSLAQAGLFGETTKISLIEWEYRNSRLRLLFSIPPEGISLSLFLSTLENLKIFKEVRLIPDTPAQTVGVQTIINLPEKTEGAR